MSTARPIVQWYHWKRRLLSSEDTTARMEDLLLVRHTIPPHSSGIVSQSCILNELVVLQWRWKEVSMSWVGMMETPAFPPWSHFTFARKHKQQQHPKYIKRLQQHFEQTFQSVLA